MSQAGDHDAEAQHEHRERQVGRPRPPRARSTRRRARAWPPEHDRRGARHPGRLDAERREHREADQHQPDDAPGVRRAAARSSRRAVPVGPREVPRGRTAGVRRTPPRAPPPTPAPSSRELRGTRVAAATAGPAGWSGWRPAAAGRRSWPAGRRRRPRPRATTARGRGGRDDRGEQHDGRVQAQHRRGDRRRDEGQRSIRRGLPRPARATSVPTAANTPSAAHTSATTRIAARNATTGNSSRTWSTRAVEVDRADQRAQRRRRPDRPAPRPTRAGARTPPRAAPPGRATATTSTRAGGTAEAYAPRRSRFRPLARMERVSGQAGRYQRSAGGMVGALIVLVVLIVGLGRLPSRHRTTRPAPVRTVDYAKVAGAGPRRRRRFDLVAPRVACRGLAGHLGALHRRRAGSTGTSACSPTEDRYVGLEQGAAARARPWSRSTSTEAVARRAGRRATGGLVDVHRRRGRPGPGPHARPDHHAGGRARRAAGRRWWPTPPACAESATRVVRLGLVAGDRRVEPLLGAVEPAPGRSARASRRAPTAPATPRGRCRRTRGDAPPRPAPRGPPRSSGGSLGAGGHGDSSARGRVGGGAGHLDGDAAVGDPDLEGLAGRGRSTRGDDVAVGVLHDGVAAPQGGQRRHAPHPGQLVAEVVAGPVELVVQRAPGPVAQGVDLAGPVVETAAGVGQRRPGADRVERVLLAGQPGGQHLRGRGRAGGRPGRPPRPTSGTTSLAASVGVEARTSATRSSSGLSGSWPIAETTGVRAANTARSRPSSENGSRSSTEPPPRAITITSTVGVAVEPAERLDHLGRRAGALHRGVADREPDRRPAAAGVLEHVALGGAVRRGDQADRARAGTAAGACARRRTAPRPRAAGGGARCGRAARRARPCGSRGRRATACRGWRRTTAWRAPRPRRPRPSAG